MCLSPTASTNITLASDLQSSVTSLSFMPFKCYLLAFKPAFFISYCLFCLTHLVSQEKSNRFVGLKFFLGGLDIRLIRFDFVAFLLNAKQNNNTVKFLKLPTSSNRVDLSKVTVFIIA